MQSLMSGIPTILFWEPGLWELRPSAQPSFDMLRESGILFDEPEAAAAATARAYASADRWLANADVARARERFLDRYALQRKNWRREWLQRLDRVPAKAAVLESAS